MEMTYDAVLLSLLALCLIVTGAVAGTLAGLLGVGGGIVIVPVLFIIFEVLEIPNQVAMHLAVATSLATIIPTSISSARAHMKKGTVDAALLKGWSPLIFVGAAAGGVLAKFLESGTLTLIFGVIAFLVALNMFRRKALVLADALPRGIVGYGVVPGFIGLFSALMGIGGGTLSVPTLSAFSVPVHRAVGTASAFGLVIAVPAVAGFIWAGWGNALLPPLSVGYVNIPAAVLIFSASVVTAPFGARIAHALNAVALRRAFAFFLLLSSINMLRSVV
jgi:uncharacterized membrane protein YfcA